MPTMFGYMLEKLAIDEALEKALATPIEKKVADMMANSHEYKKPNIQGALTFVKNYTWEERTIPLSRLQGINKPIKKEKVFEIAKTLEKNGDTVEWPFIVVNKLHGIRPQTHGKVVLMDGHHRMEACKARGIKEVPVYFGTYTGGAEIEDDELYKEVPNEKATKDYSEKLKNLRARKDPDNLEKIAEELIEKKIVTQDDLYTVARIVHEINRHYNKLLMDREDPSWDELKDKDKENRISLLSATVPDIKTISAKKMHDMWVGQQAKEGWIHGESYDSKKKTHPCIVSWKELPELEKAKDAMYLAVIKAMTELHFGIDKTIDSKIKEVKIPGGEKVLMNKSASMFRQLLEKQAAQDDSYLKDFVAGMDPTGVSVFRRAMNTEDNHAAHRAVADTSGFISGAVMGGAVPGVILGGASLALKKKNPHLADELRVMAGGALDTYNPKRVAGYLKSFKDLGKFKDLGRDLMHTSKEVTKNIDAAVNPKSMDDISFERMSTLGKDYGSLRNAQDSMDALTQKMRTKYFNGRPVDEGMSRAMSAVTGLGMAGISGGINAGSSHLQYNTALAEKEKQRALAKNATLFGTLLEKQAFFGVGIPVVESENGVSVNVGFPYGVGVQKNFRRDKFLNPAVGLGLLGPYLALGINPNNLGNQEIDEKDTTKVKWEESESKRKELQKSIISTLEKYEKSGQLTDLGKEELAQARLGDEQSLHSLMFSPDMINKSATLFGTLLEKQAADKESEITNKDIAGGISAAVGAGIISDQMNKGNLSGREKLYHGTNAKNVKSILEEGIKAPKEKLKPGSVTETVIEARGYDPKDFLNKTYMGTKPHVASGVNTVASMNAFAEMDDFNMKNYMQALKESKPGMVVGKVPTWKMDVRDNPELRGAKSGDEFYKVLKETNQIDFGDGTFLDKIQKSQGKAAYKALSDQTRTFEGDIPAEFLKGKNYKRQTIEELLEFIKANPKRFAKGSLMSALGGAGVAGGGYLLSDRLEGLMGKEASELGKRSLQQTNNIRTSAEAGRMLELKYKDKSGNVSVRFVEPYKLTDEDFWGYDPEQGGIRRFKIKNIKAVKKTTKAFTPQWPIETSPIQKAAMATAVQKRYNENALSKEDQKRVFQPVRAESKIHDSINSKVKRFEEMGDKATKNMDAKKYKRITKPNNLRHAPSIDSKRMQRYVGKESNSFLDILKARYGPENVEVEHTLDNALEGYTQFGKNDAGDNVKYNFKLPKHDAQNVVVNGSMVTAGPNTSKGFRTLAAAHEIMGEGKSVENTFKTLLKRNQFTNENLSAIGFGTHLSVLPTHIDSKVTKMMNPGVDGVISDVRKSSPSHIKRKGVEISEFEFLKDMQGKPNAKNMRELSFDSVDQMRRAAEILGKANSKKHTLDPQSINEIVKTIFRRV